MMSPREPEISLGGDEIESNTHSFIVRMWSEEADEATGRIRWRGHLTHVLSGKRHYIKELSDIPSLIATYLGVRKTKTRRWERVKRWLKTRKG